MSIFLRIAPLARASLSSPTFSARCAMSTSALSRTASSTTSRFGSSKIASAMKPQLAGGVGARRNIMYPALLGRRLGDIMDIPRLKQQLKEDVEKGLPNIAEDLWVTHHANLDDAIGGSIPASDLESFREFTEKCPIFVFPVPKSLAVADKGKFYVMYCEWKGDMAMFTYLEDKRNNPQTAEPRMSIHLYADSTAFCPSVFLRCDLSPLISKDEAIILWQSVLHYYAGEGRKHVDTFNHDPEKFDFNKVFEM